MRSAGFSAAGEDRSLKIGREVRNVVKPPNIRKRGSRFFVNRQVAQVATAIATAFDSPLMA
jgi:hypothetical protein